MIHKTLKVTSFIIGIALLMLSAFLIVDADHNPVALLIDAILVSFSASILYHSYIYPNKILLTEKVASIILILYFVLNIQSFLGMFFVSSRDLWFLSSPIIYLSFVTNSILLFFKNKAALFLFPTTFALSIIIPYRLCGIIFDYTIPIILFFFYLMARNAHKQNTI